MYSLYHANNRANLCFVKVKCCKLSSDLETTKPKEAKISRKVILKRHHPSLFFHNTLIVMRHKLDASFCSDDWFETGRTNDRANCSLHFFSEHTNVENTTLMLNPQNQQRTLMQRTCHFPKLIIFTCFSWPLFVRYTIRVYERAG